MAKKGKQKKFRVALRKNRQTRTRTKDLTRRFQQEDPANDESVLHERVSGKGELTRKRTIVAENVVTSQDGLSLQIEVDRAACLPGVVLRMHGPKSVVQTQDGVEYRCSTRQILKSLNTEDRNAVAVGDRVLFLPTGEKEGVIERVEPRHGVISRASRRRRHIIVSNVDQLPIIASAAEPALKPNLIDRMLVTAEKTSIRPIICINKVDLIDLADLQPLAGVYAQLGYQVLAVSASTGFNIPQLRRVLAGRQSVVAGQSGVGKSSLLNAVESGLQLRVATVSRESQKGRHTTTASWLVPLEVGGFVVDTPGIRQFQLWDVIPEEVAGFFPEMRPYVSQCRFPDCTHTHEIECAVKNAVADGRLDVRRYESFCHLLEDDPVL